MYIGLHVKYRLFLWDFNQTWTFSTEFRKILKYQISWKSVQWEPSCSTRTDGQRTLIVAFWNFAEAPKMRRNHVLWCLLNYFPGRMNEEYSAQVFDVRIRRVRFVILHSVLDWMRIKCLSTLERVFSSFMQSYPCYNATSSHRPSCLLPLIEAPEQQSLNDAL
jgi:hypothetical protein